MVYPEDRGNEEKRNHEELDYLLLCEHLSILEDFPAPEGRDKESAALVSDLACPAVKQAGLVLRISIPCEILVYRLDIID